MNLELHDKVAVVTGGSRGIGKAVAAELAREGARVALVARDITSLESVAAALAASSGRVLRAYAADCGVDAQVRAVVAAIDADFGRIDILINCAAKPAGQGPPVKLAEIDDANFFDDVNVKVLGYIRFAREVAPIMRRGGFGRIVNISGLAARQTGSIIGSIRNVSVAALTKNLADELGPFGINVTCVHPGYTRTEKTPDAMRYQASAHGLSVEAMEQRMNDANAIRHLVTAEEVAHVVAFLASPKSIAVTGDVIAAGGGMPGPIYY